MPAFKVLKKAIISLHMESHDHEPAVRERSILDHLCATLDQMDKVTDRDPANDTDDLMTELFTKFSSQLPVSTSSKDNNVAGTFYSLENTLKEMILLKLKPSTIKDEQPSAEAHKTASAHAKNTMFALKAALNSPVFVNTTDLGYDSDNLTSPSLTPN